jgi:hypothetical protein
MAPKTEQDLHRLQDIEAEEVSLVDRAANKRRFLLIKRSDPMGANVGPEVKEKNGELTTDTDHPVIKMRKEWRDGLLASAAGALEQLAKVVEMAKGAELCEDADLAYPDQIAKDLSTVAEAIKAAAKPKKEEPGEKGKAEDKTAKPDDKEATQKADVTRHKELLQERVGAIQELVGQLGGATEPEKLNALIDKLNSMTWGIRDLAGVANMATVAKADSQWMAQLKGFIEDLKKILEEHKRAPQDAPAGGGANMGSGTQPDTTAASDAQSVMGKIPGLGELMKSMDGLASQLRSVADLKTGLKKAQDEIAVLKGSVDLPASQGHDGPAPASPSGDVDWPLDLNAKNRGESF